MPSDTEHAPRDRAPASGVYRLLNVAGNPTDHHFHVAQGEPLPAAPRGHTWRLEREAED